METAAAVWQDVQTFFVLHPVFCWSFVAVILVNNAVRVTWRDFTTRPKAARFLVAITDPIAGNFWRLTLWSADKVGIKLQAPDSTDTVSPQAVADAVKRDAVAVQEVANIAKKSAAP
jgi:hypothetical protein